MDAVELIASATMQAAALHTDRFPKLVAMRRDRPADYHVFVVGGLRQCLKADLPGVLKEWEAALDSHLSDAWLREMLNIQANTIAVGALRLLEEEL